MGVRGITIVDEQRTHADDVRLFAEVLLQTPADCSHLQLKLHEKIYNDYFQYLKKTLNAPSTIDPNFRKILLARLNKLFAEGFFEVQPILSDEARIVIDDIANNDVLLKAEFIEPEDKENFIARFEDGKFTRTSVLSTFPLKLKTGYMKGNFKQTSKRSSAREILSKFFDDGMTDFLSHDWDQANDRYKAAIEFLDETLSKENDYAEISAELEDLIATCLQNNCSQAIENRLADALKDVEMNNGFAMEIHIDDSTSEYTIHVDDSYDENLNLIHHPLLTVNTTNNVIVEPLLELNRRFIKSIYSRVKLAIASKDFETLIDDIHYAISKNHEALNEYHYPQEIKANITLRKLLIIALYNTAHVDLTLYRDKARELLNHAMELADELYSYEPTMHEDLNLSKLIVSLKYKISYIYYLNGDFKNALIHVENAANLFWHLEEFYHLNKGDNKTSQQMTILFYRSSAILNSKIALSDSKIDTNQIISHFHLIIESLTLIPTTLMTREDSKLLMLSRRWLTESLDIFLKQFNAKDQLNKFIDLVKTLNTKAVNTLLKDTYLKYLMTTSNQIGLRLQHAKYFGLAFERFKEVELFWYALSPTSDQKTDSILILIRCYQAECSLQHHNSLHGYKSEKLTLLIRASEIFAKVGYDNLSMRHKTHWNNIKELLVDFHTQTNTQMDSLIDLLKISSADQNQNAFFEPPKTEFASEIKPLILSLRDDKTIPYLEKVKTDIANYQTKHPSKNTKLCTSLTRLINNYVLCDLELRHMKMGSESNHSPRPR